MTIDTAKMRADTLAPKAPERIWIEADDGCPYHYVPDEDRPDNCIEYVRADLAAENLRLLDEIERLTAENARLRAERDAAWKAGAEAMRKEAARAADNHPYPTKTAESLWSIERACIGAAIRALPLPGQPKEGENAR